MASLASVNVSSANNTIVPWSVVYLDPSQNFGELFESVQAGKFAIIKTSGDLSAAILESDGMSVGKDKSSLSVVAKELNTVDVCAAFGLFVKITVSLDEPGVSSTLDVSKNAFKGSEKMYPINVCDHRRLDSTRYTEKCRNKEPHLQ